MVTARAFFKLFYFYLSCFLKKSVVKHSNLMGDLELKEGLRTGSSAAIEYMYDKYFERECRWIIQHNGSREEAKDVFQDALMAIYESLQKPDYQITSQAGTFLHAICRNLWFKQLRDDRVLRKSTDEGLELVEEEQAATALQLLGQDHLYKKMFLKLSEQCQNLLKRFLEGQSMKQITEEMSLSSENYTKKRKHQCKSKLVELIKEDPMYQEVRE